MCTEESPLPPVDYPEKWPVCNPSTPATPCGFVIGPPGPGIVRFAVIGDWGDTICTQTCSQTVATMVNLWQPYDIEFIITTGDNNYPSGNAEDLVKNMALYADWSPWPVPGGPPAAGPPRFFPTLGNHDLITCCGQPYLDYFAGLAATSSSGNARYYNYARPDGLVEIFSLNPAETLDGTDPKTSKQAAWFRTALNDSKAAWKIVMFHEPVIGTSQHEKGDKALEKWDFAGWGADLVLMGHQHLYERIVDPDTYLTYVINGLGGTSGLASIRDDKFGPSDDQGCRPYIARGSRVRFNRSVGAMIGAATATSLHFCFLVPTADQPEGVCIDNFFVEHPKRGPAARPD